MFSTLKDYCRWGWFEGVSDLLNKTSDLDVTQDECNCINLAIALESSEILGALLKYYSQNNPNPPHEERMRIAENLGDRVSFKTKDMTSLGDLTPEMMDIVIEYTPWLARKALLTRAMHDDVDTVRYLYPHFPEERADILEEIATFEAYEVMEVIAQMQSSEHEKAMVYCDIGDSLNRNGIYAKACEFYEKAILADPTYIIPYIHYANNIVEQLCSSDSFNMDLALKSEEYYKKAIEFNPKYSSAYKKLGILYQEIAENQSDDSLKEHYAIKAFRSYIDAVKNKSEKLKYDSVYQEIKHIVMLYHSNDEVQKIIGGEVDDTKLQKLFTQITLGSISEDGSDVSDTSEILRKMAEEDFEYEETDMDADLIGETSVVTDV